MRTSSPSRNTSISLCRLSMRRMNIVRRYPGVRSTPPNAAKSPLEPVKTVSASSRGVPRRHLLTTSGNPAADVDPSPKSVPTSTVFSSSQLMSLLASARLNPSATNSRVTMSNSRTTAASEPPSDRLISARGVLRLDNVGASPHPVLILGSRQGIHVQDDIPVR